MANCGKAEETLVLNNIDKKREIIYEVNAKYIQVGNDNKAYVDASLRRTTDSLPTIETSPSPSPGDITVTSDIIQVIPGDDSWPNDVKVNVNCDTCQVGNNSVLNLTTDDEKGGWQSSLTSPKKLRRKPKKKEESNTKPTTVFTSSLSEEAVLLYNTFFEKVLAVLHPLRDDGKFDQFCDRLNEFRVEHGGDPVWDILLTLEQAQQMCYDLSAESNIVQSVEILLELLRKIPECLKGVDQSIRQLVEGRAYCYLASAYRHQKGNFLGSANECLAQAEQRLKGTVFLYDEASVYYEKASILLEYDRSNTQRIRTCLDRCSEICEEIKRTKKWDFVKKGHFAKIKKVMWLLNSNTNGGRKRTISDDNLNEATEFLAELESENKVRKNIPASEQLQCLVANSDQAFRCGRYHEAKEIIETAIWLARKHGFDEKPSLKRLQDIQTMIGKNTTSCPLHLVAENHHFLIIFCPCFTFKGFLRVETFSIFFDKTMFYSLFFSPLTIDFVDA